MKLLKFALLLAFCAAIPNIYAQEMRILSFDEYINNVKESNIGYLAEKYNVDIADAMVKAARVFPDPELSVSYANNQDWNLKMGYGIDAELGYTLELGGKRRARIKLAQSEKEMTQALLIDYFRNLKADATIAYLSAIYQKSLLDIQKSTYNKMRDLARADSIRYSLGDITEVDALQSKLEAATMLNEVFSSESDLKDALVRLELLQGFVGRELPDSVSGSLIFTKRDYELSALIETALANRADLQAALKSNELSHNNLKLAKANRAMDLGISIGASHASVVKNEIAPAPSFTGITAGLSIPLRFSNTNKGELKAAQLAVEQSERQYQAVQQEISSQVAQAYYRYVAFSRQVEQYNKGLTDDAASILQKKIFSYSRGETTMLDVLNAKQTYNDVLTNYYTTLYNCAEALVELERVCGVGDVEIR